MKRSLFTLFIALCTAPAVLYGQQVDWLNGGGGTFYDVGADITADAAGYSYATGTVYCSATSYPRFGDDTIHAGTFRSYEAYIIKHDIQGNRRWVTSVGGTGAEVGTAIELDSDTTFVIAGLYNSSNATFDTLNGPAASTANVRLFVAQFDTSGGIRWLQTAPLGQVFVYPFYRYYNPSISVNDSGDILISGLFRGQGIFGTDTISASTATDYDGFIAKIDNGGNWQFAEAFAGSAGWTFAGSVASGNDGSIYVSGSFNGSMTIDTITLGGSSGSYDVYFAKLNDTGRVQWATELGTAYYDEGYGISIDRFDNLYLAGRFGSSITLDTVTVNAQAPASNVQDIFLSRWNTNGDCIWGKACGGTAGFYANWDYCYGMDTDDRGNVAITGQSGGSAATFGSHIVPGNGSLRGVYFALSDSLGDFTWAVGGYGSSFAFNQGNNLSIDSAKNLYATGQGDPPLVFDNTTWASGGGLRDAFIIKISDCSEADTAEIYAPTVTTGCQGDTVTLSSNGNPNLEYRWLHNGSPIFLGTDTVYDAFVSGSYQVAVSDDGCLDTSSAVSVTINTLPNVSLASLDTVCVDGGTVVLTQGSPSGGVYKGIGMINDTVFDPGTSGQGSFLIWYVYEDGSTGCKDSTFGQIVVTGVTATLAVFADMCEQDAAITLTGGSPIGGTFFVNAVSKTTFDPSVEGAGDHTIWYVVTASGCSDTAIRTLHVDTAPTVSLSPLADVCVTTPSIVLSGGTPSGGTFSGPGVAFGNFFPTFAGGVGTYNITYTFTDGNGCDGSDVETITVDPNFTISFNPTTTFCPGDPNDTLTATPVGGVFSGTGVINDSIFSPVTAGVGSHIVQYKYTNACKSDSVAKTITVSAGPNPSMAAISNICYGATPITLNQGSPAGGTYSGPGVSGTTFNPTTAGVGTHTIKYTVTDVSGCTDSASTTVQVLALPTVTFSALTDVCVDASAFTLSGGSPTGGTYSGDGVSGGMFTPSTAGVGSHTVTYVYTDANSCTDSASQVQVVDSLPTVTFSVIPDVCANSPAFTLTQGSPSGGAYSGTGVSGSTFNPATSGSGTFTLTYSFTDGNGCSNSANQNVTVDTLPNVTIGTFSDLCFGASPITLSSGSPSGGSYFGPGVSGTTFNPSTAGAGMHTIGYTFTDGNTCSDSATTTITVDPLPTVTLSSLTAVCVDASAFALSGGSPSGGTYSGTGVSGGNFNPATAGVGSHIITYTYTDANTCTDSASQTQVVDSLPTVTFSTIPDVCANAASFTLTQGSPLGGTYSGIGVSGSTFDPAVSGTGTFTLTYSFTDGNGCSNSANQNVTVDTLPNVTIGTFSDLCFGATPITLSSGSPSGGTYFGTGVSGTTFNPTTAGAGTHIIGYTFTDGNTCSDSATTTITVDPLPTVTLSSLSAVCVDASAFALSGGSPSGGTYSGTGVSAGMFNPSSAGVGSHTITYTFTDANTCTDSASQTQVVDSLPVVSFSAIADLCANAAPITLTQGSPSGGTYSGTGVSGSTFDPTSSGTGTFTLTYSFTDGNGCSGSANQTVTVDTLPNVTIGTFSDLCFGASPITLSSGSPSGGTYFGTGVSGTTFNPTSAGAGTHTVGYTFTDGNTCTDSATTTITVDPLPSVSLSALTDVCVDASTFALSGGSPSGGTYSGTGVSGGNFNPAVAGVGSHTITYTFTDGNSCTDSASQIQVVDSLPTVSFSAIADLCANASPITLTQGAPSGGSYSGTGVSGSTFDPSSSGTGTFTLTYSFTDGNGCSNSANQNVTVDTLPNVTIGTLSDLCFGATPITLSSGSPSGGTYFGTGVSGVTFNPTTAGAGTHTIGYTFTDGNSCTDSASTTITVDPLPTVTLSALSPVCADASTFALTGGTPSGGTYSGTGVSGGNFNPTIAGVGSHTITYTFTDANTCTDSTSQVQVVDTLPTVTFSTIPAVCADASAFTLTQGSPIGGTYSGTGVSGSTFDPATSGTGTFTLTYSFTDGNSCSNSANQTVTVDTLPNVSLAPFADVCAGANSFTLSGGAPAGGTYFGTGVLGSSFDPGVAGAGTHTLGYAFVDGNTCTDTATSTITVDPQPTVTLSGLSGVCLDNGSFMLTGGSPSGGTYSGAGISSGSFDPSTAGVGSHTLKYVFTDANSCTDSATATQVVFALPTVTFSAISDLCADANVITLNQGAPSGGTYSGIGVSGGTFDPAVSGTGVFTLTYDFTDSNSCSDTATQTVRVDTLPTVGISSISDICFGSDPVVLTQGSPSGGTYFGNGVTGDTLNPASAGVGTHNIGYTFVDGNTCTDTASTTVTVIAQPSVSLSSFSNLCGNSDTLALSGGLPAGGTYTGTGVSGGTFDPLASGVGAHTITYSFTAGTGCSDSASQSITVDTVPTVSLSSLTDVCDGVASFSLTGGLPAGGTYSGTGVSSGNFDPASAGVGTHTIQYAFVDLNSCRDSVTQSITVDSIPLVSLATISDMCFGATPISLSGGSPAGGIYAGPGVVSGLYDPSMAGAGVQTIRYSFTDGNGCTDSANTSTNVFALPSVSISSLGALCLNTPKFELTNGLPVGGSYSGLAVTNDSLDASMLPGAGTDSIQYLFTDLNGCTDSASLTINVDSVPSVTLSALSNVCFQEPTMLLTNGLPSGGTYSGVGVSAGMFDPAIGIGPQTINYVFTDGNSCSDSASTAIVVDTLPSVSIGALGSYCEQSGDVVLTAGLPSGGIYYGPGMVNDTLFNPDSVGAASSNLAYVFTDGNGCSDSAFATIGVDTLPIVTFTYLDTVCRNFDLDTLRSGLPLGGIYTGTGVSLDSIFDPSSTTVGLQTITYVFTDLNGCIDSADVQLEIHPDPTSAWGANFSVCENESSFTLSGGSPVGGIYFGGVAVSDSIYNPSLVSIGMDTAFYVATNYCGADTSSAVISVLSKPFVSSTDTAQLCPYSGSHTLSIGLPLGGVYFGEHILQDTLFDSNFGEKTGGVYSVNYTFHDGTCADTILTTVSMDELPDLSFDHDTTVCLANAVEIVLDSNLTDVVWNLIPGNSSRTFGPEQLNIGVNQMIISARDGGLCWGSDTVTITVIPCMSFVMMPNPSDGQFEVELNSMVEDEVMITLYNGLGQPILDKLTMIESGLNTLPFDLRGMDGGLYVIKIEGHYIDQTEKFFLR